MEKISVIIPVFNVQKYLDRCINSVVSQRNVLVEVILINDGSDDNSGMICDSWAEKDERVKVIHKKNEGLSIARNVGIDVATGKYITFVDSDDYLPEKILEHQYQIMITHDVDIVCNAYMDILHQYYTEVNSEKITGIEAAKRMFVRQGIDSNACCKLYKSELFQNIRFPAGMLYENVGVTYKVLLRAKNVFVSNIIGYFIETRNNSITRSCFKNKDLDYLVLSQKVLADIEINNPELKEYANTFYLESIIFLMEKINNKKVLSQKGIDLVKVKFRENFIEILSSKYIGRRKKVISILIMSRVYKLVWPIYSGIRQMHADKELLSM